MKKIENVISRENMDFFEFLRNLGQNSDGDVAHSQLLD